MVVLKNPNDYTFLRFEQSKLKLSKYDAVLLNNKTGNEIRVPFGGKKPNGQPYDQYKDQTGLGLYSKYDHNSVVRRNYYRQRHNGEQDRKYSSGYWSWFYLW